uniref:Uncharacterized protein n=1 Tax=Zea mays TaxID=4577 RepID=C0PM50_MAIZE|nr:unknown [Zea mays]ACR36702.1 unknown [Zea mays]
MMTGRSIPSYESVFAVGLCLVAAGRAGTRLLWRWRRLGRRWLWRRRPRLRLRGRRLRRTRHWRPRLRARTRRWRAVVEALVAAALHAHRFLFAKGWEAEALADDALVVADGRQVLEALAEAPVVALAARDDGRDVRIPGTVAVVKGVLVAALPRARVEALPVVHVLVVHRHRRRGEERGNSQDDAERRAARRFVSRHRSQRTWSAVQGELADV